jgi:psiF repeat-containing protein
MRTILATVILGLSAIAAHAQEGPTPQQQLASDCNAQANKQKVLKFSDRKAFIDACMRGETPKKAAAKAAPKKAAANQDKAAAKREKSKACGKQADDRKLKGDERKKYMSQCAKA